MKMRRIALAHTILTNLFLTVFAWNLPLAAAAPPVVLSNLSTTNGSNTSFTLHAWPGEYLIQSASQLSGVWSNECLVAVGRDGHADGAVPGHGRS
ncbi:MAG: hypothetical protein IT579_16555, partial [Verrucomicrobia subdivision 3 bacterium]|nr:hypothetical protein [Limisphaerales bacterium]